MAEIVAVADPDDPRIAAYRNVRDRDLAGGHGGRFVAEGETVLAVALTAGRFRMESLLVAENRVAALEPLFAAHDLPVFVAPMAVMEAIVGFPIHRGVLGVGLRGTPADPGAPSSGRPPPSAPGPC